MWTRHRRASIEGVAPGPVLTRPAYAVANAAAARVFDHLQLHRGAAAPLPLVAAELLPDAPVIEAMVDAAFWASVRREEGYVPKISLAYLPPTSPLRPMRFAHPLPLDPTGLTRLAAAVERPGVHLGVWRDGSALAVWGTTHAIPPFCFVVEVVAPGLLVLKHRPRHESRKFVNVAVLEGDRMKIVDERAVRLTDCPPVLGPMIGVEAEPSGTDRLDVLVQLALSMRRHGRGGILLVVPAASDAWRASIIHPVRYAIEPAFSELAELARGPGPELAEHEWLDAMTRAIDAMAGLTAVDGATIVRNTYELLAFGAKIVRRVGGAPVGDVIVTEPVEGSVPERVDPGTFGGTRHLSAAQFVRDQPDGLAMVASQDGRFTIFSWSPCDEAVHARRVDVLLM